MPLLRCFVSAAPGLEPILDAELAELGIPAVDTEIGGITVSVGPEQLATLLLWLRTANRVTVRMGSFRARTFPELERHAGAIDWQQFAGESGRIHFRITSKKSRLYHEGAIAERLERSVMAAVPGIEAVRAAVQAEALEDNPLRLPGVQRIIVRVHRDQFTLSADASGAGLHRRGYRQATAKAPLRETLAAAMLLGCGWNPGEPLADPFAGSGTIPIEAALLARRIAPGLRRRFAVEAWNREMTEVMCTARENAMTAIRPPAGISIEASDRDPGAIQATHANAARAGVATDITTAVAPLSALPARNDHGWIVTNPPYGVRIGEVAALRALYATLGQILVTRRPGWSLAWLSAHPLLAGQVGITPMERWHTSNGGIPVTLLTAAPR